VDPKKKFIITLFGATSRTTYISGSTIKLPKYVSAFCTSDINFNQDQGVKKTIDISKDIEIKKKCGLLLTDDPLL